MELEFIIDEFVIDEDEFIIDDSMLDALAAASVEGDREGKGEEMVLATDDICRTDFQQKQGAEIQKSEGYRSNRVMKDRKSERNSVQWVTIEHCDRSKLSIKTASAGRPIFQIKAIPLLVCGVLSVAICDLCIACCVLCVV